MTVSPSLGVSVLTLAEARALITADSPTGQLTDDVVVQRYIDAATTAVERVAGPIVVRSVTRTWSGGTTSINLPWRPLVAYGVTIVENGVTLTQGVDFDVDADSAILYRGIWPASLWFHYGRNNVVVTCYVGFDPLPGVLKSAVAEQFRDMWQGSQQSSSRPGLGAQQAGAVAPSNLDPLMAAAAAYGIMPGFA